MAVEPLQSKSAPKPVGPYAAAVRAGEWVIVSGQIGIDPATGELVGGDTAAQTEQALANLRAVLFDVGLGLEDVAKTTVFVTDIDEFPVVNTIYKTAFGYHRPARATAAVAALPLGAAVLVEAWAHDRGTA